jgi:hypothetical protein
VSDPRRYSPAARRNADPLGRVLEDVLPGTGRVLEIASGSGEHAVAFAGRFPGIRWQPTDPDADARASIDAHREDAGLPNLEPARSLDVRAPKWWGPWLGTPWSAVVAINLVHIAPWDATLGLLEGSARLLAQSASLVLYGPYFEDAVVAAPSNEAFDRSLRERDPHWGVRKLEDVRAEAVLRGFELERRVAMPANNLTVVFRRRP